jgi:hypothetical protein
MAGRIAYLGNIVTQGLVLDLDAAIKGSYPGTGTTWTDVSNNGNNGTLTNGPTFTGSDYGAIVFDGTNDYVNLNTGLGSGDFLIDMWIKKPNSGSSSQSLIGYYVDQNNPGVMVWTSTTTPIFRISAGTGSYAQMTLGNIADDTWRNLTISGVRTGNAVGYINGAPINQVDITSQPCSVSLATVGNIPIMGYLSGSVAAVKGYRQALTQFQVWQNFNSYKSRYGIPDIVTDGLVLNLDAGNPYSYLSGSSGTTWSNTVAVSSSISGTLTNGPVYSNGAITFDGSDDYVGYGNVLNFERTDSFSLSGWVRISSLSSFRAIIAKMDSSFRGYLFAVETTGQVVFILRNTSTTNGIIVRTASSPIAINTWYNITVTYNGTSSPNGVNVYVNSEIISNSVAQDNLSSTVLNSQAGAIGARIGPNDGYLLGNIATTQIYNRALSATEITQNFNALRGRYGI